MLFTVPCFTWLTEELLKNESPSKVGLTNSEAPKTALPAMHVRKGWNKKSFWLFSRMRRQKSPLFQENKTPLTAQQEVWTWKTYPLKVIGFRDLPVYTRGRHLGLQKVTSFWVIAEKKVNKSWLKSTSCFNASSLCPCLTSMSFLPGSAW